MSIPLCYVDVREPVVLSVINLRGLFYRLGFAMGRPARLSALLSHESVGIDPVVSLVVSAKQTLRILFVSLSNVVIHFYI